MNNNSSLHDKLIQNKLKTSDIDFLTNLEIQEFFAILIDKKEKAKDVSLIFKYHFLISKIYSYLKVKQDLMTKTKEQILKEVTKNKQPIKAIMLHKVTSSKADFLFLLDDTIEYYS